MAIAEEDGLIVDLVVGGISQREVRDGTSTPVDSRRLDAVARFFRLLDLTPATEPPRDLVDATLKRIDDAA